MIDWNKRNGGFLSPESVYNDQLGNLSQQINEKDKEIERLNNIIQSINSVCSSMQFSAPENMYIHLQRMIEVLDKWKKEKNND